MLFFWELMKRKDRSDFNKEEKAFHDIAERKYIDTIKEEIKRLNFYNTQPY